MAELPTGTVTFLFTDIEGSTRLWEEHPDAMKGALARHDEILRDAVESHGGHIVKTTGDGVHAAFATAHDAVDAAVEAQRGLGTEPWSETGPLTVRMGIHTGEAEQRDGDYYGSALNRAARLMGVAHGGQVLISHVTEELVGDSLSAGVETRDLGEHRLRDLSRPERVFQLLASDLDSEFAPLKTFDAFPGNLPLQVTSFVGRADELRAIAQALTQSRLVTITGVGGVGKTRLAIEAAAVAAAGYPDGVWLCELAAASDAASMEQVVASTLGATPRAGMSLVDSILDFLAAKTLLLVLDNCEHLLDAAAHLTAGVLRSCPKVRVLATSREGLAVDGERVHALRSLALPDTSTTGGTVGTSDAVQLFAERAQAVRSSFELDAANALAVSEICRRLDGIPLAIELAAARVVAMSPADISALLDERFRLLTGGRRTAAERHQTLRATVEWSYALLAEHEQLIFDRLGVFAGSFDAQAATAVVGGDGVDTWDVVDAMTSLVAKSMVVAEEADDGGVRYQLLETLRQYARERLDESGDPDAWRCRHAEHYAGFAEEAGVALRGPDELVWRRRVPHELDDLRAAVVWALDRDDADDVNIGVRIVAGLAHETDGELGWGIGTWAAQALPHLDASSLETRIAVLAAAGWESFYRGDYEGACALAREAIRDGIPAGCRTPGLPFEVLILSEQLARRAPASLAVIDDAERALDAAGAAPVDKAHVHGLAVASLMMVGRLDEAAHHAALAIELAREAGNPTVIAQASWARGWTLVDADPETALRAYDQALALMRDGAIKISFAVALYQAARLRLRLGDRRRAISDFREAVEHSHRTANRPVLFGSLHLGATLLAELGYPAPAAVLAGVTTLGPFNDVAALDSVYEGPEFERSSAVVRAALGHEEYERVLAQGAAMSYEEIIDYVSAQLDRIAAEEEQRA